LAIFLTANMNFSDKTVCLMTKKTTVHLDHVVPERPKGGINLYIKFEKHKFDQIAARNVRVYLEKCLAFSKAMASPMKKVGRQIPYLLVYKSTFYEQKINPKNRPRLIHESYRKT